MVVVRVLIVDLLRLLRLLQVLLLLVMRLGHRGPLMAESLLRLLLL